MKTGIIHSIESFGTVDGPGVRYVIFLKGCPMRCAYCHNPDTWTMEGGTERTIDDLLAEFEKKRPFYSSGGVTVTGGEPMVQLDFITELFEECKRRKINTCLDTSGVMFKPDDVEYLKKTDRLLAVTDTVMLDIKHIDPQEHMKLCKQPNDNILKFAKYVDQKNTVDIWIRHVCVPGITINRDYLFKTGQFIGQLKNLKSVDCLPYHTMGISKYERLGLDYPLKGVEPATKEQAIECRKIILEGISETRSHIN